MSSSPSDVYNWTFHYELSRPVFCKEATDNNTVKFVKESNNLKGFDIIVNNETESEARKTSENEANNLEKILIIKSGMVLTARLTGGQAVHTQTGRTIVLKTCTMGYDIEGRIDRIDTTDPSIRDLIKQDINPELEYLSKAVAHKNNGRYSESIVEAFRIIDEEKSVKHFSQSVKDYNKYQCLRNILSHREGQSLRKCTMNYFTRYFNPVRNSFDFKFYDDNNNIVILDSMSTKTQNTLEWVARDLINEGRNILKV